MWKAWERREIHKMILVGKSEENAKVHPCTGTEALYRPYGP
jgi:hypothetical protein